jgi:CDP-glucose 4,6-dehydratase
MIDSNFWDKRKVFISGHSGFKGSWLSLWLNNLGARITGYSLTPESPSIYDIANVGSVIEKDIFEDIRDKHILSKAIIDAKPEIVIHLAAQPIVTYSYEHPHETFETNVMGMVNLLEAIREVDTVKAILIITSDKCYQINKNRLPHVETDPMGGFDPYSSSKGCAELIADSYRRSFFQDLGVPLATARAGNIIGGGDFSKDRIVPDIIRSCINREDIILRNPNHIRPWQHVLEGLYGYIILIQELINSPIQSSSAWNFGPRDSEVFDVSTLAKSILEHWHEKIYIQIQKTTVLKETKRLTLDTTKANNLLQWEPIWDFRKIIKETMNWYIAWQQNKSMIEFTLDQIIKYQNSQDEQII